MSSNGKDSEFDMDSNWCATPLGPHEIPRSEQPEGSPCNLALTLLAPGDECPRCHHPARVHREWVREMKRTGRYEQP